MRLALLLSALSGFIALSYEIVWIRVYSMVSWGKASAFGTLLGAYLAGLAFGALLARRFCRADGHRVWSCALVEPGIELGVVSLRREVEGDRIAKVFGAEDLDLEDPEFNRSYVVGALRRKDAWKLLDPPMMEFLKRWRTIAVETRGPLFLVFRRGLLDVWAVEDLLAFTLGFLDHPPRPLVNAERSRRGLPPAQDAGAAPRHFRE